MSEQAKERILLGVTGGIAAYKGADLVRRLRERGHPVRVVMTHGACEFITPLTFQALSGEPVHRELLDETAEAAMGHIELARWADCVLVAPASAHFLAKLAHGLADDLLSTLCLATTAPIVLAPAMNTQMWLAPATRANRETLLARGVRILGPGEGEQACGELGPGRMLEPVDIVEQFGSASVAGRLAEVRVLVTAGPTQEAIDPVRFVSNRSSGKMGYAVAAAAVRLGARVTLVSGPTQLATPYGAQRVAVASADQMLAAVMSRVAEQDIVIGVAAVADYRPTRTEASKIKKSERSLTLKMERTEDILGTVSALPRRPFTVGFAAETDNLRRYALEKLEKKGLDLVAANLVGTGSGGFDDDDNALTVFWTGGSRDIRRASKCQVARDLMEIVSDHYHARNTT